MYEIVCSGPSKQVWNLSASEVSQDQQFWDAIVHLPMSLLDSALGDRLREAMGEGARQVLQGPTPAGGPEHYSVLIATGYSRDMCSAPLMGSLRLE